MSARYDATTRHDARGYATAGRDDATRRHDAGRDDEPGCATTCLAAAYRPTVPRSNALCFEGTPLRIPRLHPLCCAAALLKQFAPRHSLRLALGIGLVARVGLRLGWLKLRRTACLRKLSESVRMYSCNTFFERLGFKLV